MELRLPEHGEVANAFGAVMGSVVQRARVTVTQPLHGRFIVHAQQAPLHFDKLNDAIAAAESLASEQAAKQAETAGATEVEICLNHDENHVHHDVDGDLFLEMQVVATATGRPGFQSGNAAANGLGNGRRRQ